MNFEIFICFGFKKNLPIFFLLFLSMRKYNIYAYKSYLCPWIFFPLHKYFLGRTACRNFLRQVSLAGISFGEVTIPPPTPSTRRIFLMVRLKENKIDYVNFNPLSKFMSPHFSSSYGEAIISVPGIICGTIWGSFPVLGSFAVQFGDHLRSRDHLRACRAPGGNM